MFQNRRRVFLFVCLIVLLQALYYIVTLQIHSTQPILSNGPSLTSLVYNRSSDNASAIVEHSQSTTIVPPVVVVSSVFFWLSKRLKETSRSARSFGETNQRPVWESELRRDFWILFRLIQPCHQHRLNLLGLMALRRQPLLSRAPLPARPRRQLIRRLRFWKIRPSPRARLLPPPLPLLPRRLPPLPMLLSISPSMWLCWMQLATNLYLLVISLCRTITQRSTKSRSIKRWTRISRWKAIMRSISIPVDIRCQRAVALSSVSLWSSAIEIANSTWRCFWIIFIPFWSDSSSITPSSWSINTELINSTAPLSSTSAISKPWSCIHSIVSSFMTSIFFPKTWEMSIDVAINQDTCELDAVERRHWLDALCSGR